LPGQEDESRDDGASMDITRRYWRPPEPLNTTWHSSAYLLPPITRRAAAPPSCSGSWRTTAAASSRAGRRPTATYRVAILDGGGEAVCSSATSRGEYSVSSGGIWIDVKETKADALRRLEKGGGGFSVRCGVTVQSMERE